MPWTDLDLAILNIFFYRNILRHIYIFQSMYYLNSFNTFQNVNIYFFSISPFTLSNNKTQILKFNVYSFGFNRHSANNKYWSCSSETCNLLIDNFFLPSFSFLNYYELRTQKYKLVKSKTYFFKSVFYFNLYSAIQKYSHEHFPIKKDLIEYIYFLYYMYSVSSKEVYFNEHYKEKKAFPSNFNSTTDSCVFNIGEDKTLFLNVKRLHKVIRNIPQDYSWPLFFIITPFFLFELPCFFFLELVLDYTWSELAIVPFMLCVWWYRYKLHRKWMVTEIIRKRVWYWSGQRNDYCDVRFNPKYKFIGFYIVEGADSEEEPWLWGPTVSHYPFRGLHYVW